MNRYVAAVACASQGMTCFHKYQDSGLKTMSIDMLYTSLAQFQTKTTVWSNLDPSETVPLSDSFDTNPATTYLANYFGEDLKFESHNNFDADIGLASSSSAFASLAGAASRVVGGRLGPKELSKIARQGSFSAAASIVGGMSIIRCAADGIQTYAEPVFDAGELDDLTVLTAFSRYDKANHDFYREAASSPIIDTVRDVVSGTASAMIKCIASRDIDRLAQLSERHVIYNYSVLHSGLSSAFLWQPKTIETMQLVHRLRNDGHPIFYSMNTGANVFIYCFSTASASVVSQELSALSIEHVASKVGKPIQVKEIDETPKLRMGSQLAKNSAHLVDADLSSRSSN